MSYSAQETSEENGSPLELYDFVVGTTEYHFTSGAEEVEYDSNTYTPLEILRDTITLGSEERAEVIQIVMPAGHVFAKGYAAKVPGARAKLTIRRVHRTDDTDQLITLFNGIVRSVSFSNKAGTARIACSPASGALSRALPRFTYQSMCNHVLGDRRCTIDLELFKYTDAASSVVNNQLDVSGLGSAKGDDWATGGFVLWNEDYRLITKQTGNTLTLLLPFNEDPTADDVTVYTGCDHTLTTCKTKFDNTINYGGFPFVPTDNPFSTGINNT